MIQRKTIEVGIRACLKTNGSIQEYIEMMCGIFRHKPDDFKVLSLEECNQVSDEYGIDLTDIKYHFWNKKLWNNLIIN
jgi:hypothetical protein